MVFEVSTVESGNYTDENATCPVCNKSFKIRYDSLTKAISNVFCCEKTSEIADSVWQVRHTICDSILLISNT